MLLVSSEYAPAMAMLPLIATENPK